MNNALQHLLCKHQRYFVKTSLLFVWSKSFQSLNFNSETFMWVYEVEKKGIIFSHIQLQRFFNKKNRLLVKSRTRTWLWLRLAHQFYQGPTLLRRHYLYWSLTINNYIWLMTENKLKAFADEMNWMYIFHISYMYMYIYIYMYILSCIQYLILCLKNIS